MVLIWGGLQPEQAKGGSAGKLITFLFLSEPRSDLYEQASPFSAKPGRAKG